MDIEALHRNGDTDEVEEGYGTLTVQPEVRVTRNHRDSHDMTMTHDSSNMKSIGGSPKGKMSAEPSSRVAESVCKSRVYKAPQGKVSMMSFAESLASKMKQINATKPKRYKKID